jgi:thiamine-phosphate pyrophosphorylase
MDHAARMERFNKTDLYVVITESFCSGRKAVDVLDEVLAAGVGMVQLRGKDCDDRQLFEAAQAFREQTTAASALLIIDDRIDIALASNADGVHLGQNDLPIDVARKLAPDLIIGASTHNIEEALAAQNAGASYVNIGPIFPTQTKSVATGVVGLEMIDVIAPHVTIPFTCMGGIKIDNIGEVIKRGAEHAAVVTAVTAATDVRAAAEELRAKF